MKIKIQKANERGHTKIDWLDSWHSFSFGNYYDPSNMNFGNLRVFNDDWIAAGSGFGAHPHSEMEIITLVEEGSLAHQDSLGNKGVIKPGEVQVMSAGTGIVHAEMNGSKTQAGKFFQIWISPNKKRVEPRYEQKKLYLKKGKLNLVVSGSKEDGTLFIYQDAKIYFGDFDAKHTEIIKTGERKKHFVFLVSGEAAIDKNKMAKRDTAYIENSKEYKIEFSKPSQVIIIEV
jgi:quercetin 2,3-dioxygenase